jgi:polysaccharide export outer membrane protein
MKNLFVTTFVASILAAAMSMPALSDQKFAERDPVYRLQPGDTVEVQYRYTPEYNGTVSIQPDGLINLQLVGDIKIGGLTLHDAEKNIADRAAQRLNNPEVTVLLKDFVKPYFVVTGEVNHPGRFDMRGNVSALEAIAVSGGFKESSKHSQVILVRKYNLEMAQVTVLDLKSMMKPDRAGEDPALRPGDMLIVPQNTVSKLERYVRWSSLGVYGLGLLVQ